METSTKWTQFGSDLKISQKSEHISLKAAVQHPVIRGDQVKERDMDRGGRGIGGIGGGVEAVNSSHGKHRNQLSLLSFPLSI